jgi:ketosteroid isomerase-like protein
MKKTLLLIFIFSICVSAQSQTLQNNDEKEALAVVDRLWAAMRAKSFDGIKALFTPDSHFVAIDKPRDGKGVSKTRVFQGNAFAKMISEAKAPEFVEKMPQPDVKISGDLAIVSGRYTFHVGDKFSHCGTNTFNLVRTETGWKIANGASTLEFQCQRDLQMVAIPAVEASPADVSSIDGIVKAFYEVISGAPGVQRQWSRDKTLYAPDVRFVAMSKENAKVRAGLMNHNAYVNSSNEFFVKEGFIEREIGRKVQQFGNIAHVFSAYEWETSGERKQKGRGVNSIELYNDGARWWISAVSWDEERGDNPIPKELLSKGKK